jgi:hypothetical protein
MKLFWGIFLGLLLLLQLIGWQLFGRAQATAAVAVIAYPSAILIGAFYCYLFYRDKAWLFAMPMLLILAQIQVVYAPRRAPRDALITHALAQFLENKVTMAESMLAGSIVLLLMCLLAVASAFLTAQLQGRLTGKAHINGRALLSGTWQMFLQWEKKNIPTTQPEERNEK